MSLQWDTLGVDQEDPFSWEAVSTNGEPFVHSAVDKSGDEQHLLLLYVQNNRPELLQEDPGRCGQMYLETILEENSDDLRSSEDDSLGWGSWEDSASDDDRLTVVEVQPRGSKCEEEQDKISDPDEINEWVNSDDVLFRDSRVEDRIRDTTTDNSVRTVSLATPTTVSKVEQWIDRWIDSVCQEIMVTKANGCIENNMAGFLDTPRCVVNTVKDVLSLAEPSNEFYLFNGLSTLSNPKDGGDSPVHEAMPEFWFNSTDLEAFWPKTKGENPLKSLFLDNSESNNDVSENVKSNPFDNYESDWITNSEPDEASELEKKVLNYIGGDHRETPNCLGYYSDDAPLNVMLDTESENNSNEINNKCADDLSTTTARDNNEYWSRNLDILDAENDLVVLSNENYGSNLLSNWSMKAKFTDEPRIFPDFGSEKTNNCLFNSTNPFASDCVMNDDESAEIVLDTKLTEINVFCALSLDSTGGGEAFNPFNRTSDICDLPEEGDDLRKYQSFNDEIESEIPALDTQKIEQFPSKQPGDHRHDENIDKTGISGLLSECLPLDDVSKVTEVLDDSGYVDEETSSGSDDPPDRPPLPPAQLLANLVTPSTGQFRNHCKVADGALNYTLPEPPVPLETHKSTLAVTSPLTTDTCVSSALGCVAKSTPDIRLITSLTTSDCVLAQKGRAVSTPDLTKVTPSFGALIGKSVNERIQDYLHRARSEMKSLPEREKVRHYHRLCSSNESVCQRAARFEAGAATVQATPKEKKYTKPTAAIRPILAAGMEKHVSGKPPIPNVKSAMRMKLTNARKEFFDNLSSSKPPGPVQNPFEAFRAEAVKDRAKLASSTPDLSMYNIKAPVRTLHRSTAASPTKSSASPYRRCTGDIVWTSYTDYLHQQKRKPVSEQPYYLETDIDTLVSRTICETSLDSYRAISMLALDSPSPQPPMEDGTRARSMDFLLEDDNRAAILAPENTLGGRVKSERELRFERSLQNLNLPDWYKQSEWSKKPKEGFLLKRGADKQGWKSSGSRTPSVSSLTSGTPRKFSTDWRNVASLRSSRESLPTGSSCSLSPREQGTFQYGMSRWSSSRLSTGSAPSSSATQHTWNRSFRQPYMGWRAAAAAAAQSPGSGSLSPAPQSPLYVSRYSPTSPRLIADLGDRRPDSQASNGGFSTNLSDLGGQTPHERPLAFCRDRYSYIQSVYNSELSWDLGQPEVMVTHHQSPSETSPQRSKMVWMESSFINDRSNRPPHQASDHHRMPPREPIGKSEDGDDEEEEEEMANPFDTMQDPSLQGTPKSMGTIKCQRPKCTKSLPVEEARSKFRTCSNCYTYYCSRHCRKLHWQRHQSICPHTKISNLCKQVLMKVRDDPTSRRHLSTCARRGLLSRGRGAVKLMFPSPESALDYLCNGWDTVKAQTIYISRADLLPQDIGEDIFSQVRTLCEKYNPERKFVLLAAIVVTNELSSTPGMCLEREVIVRGTKLHLAAPLVEDDVPTLILTVIKDPNPKETTLEDRRNGLSAIEQQMMDRGVPLAKQFPEVYFKLSRFVENNISFAPVNIFPTDQRTKKLFMCIILPWADGDIILNISSKTSGGKSKKKH